MKNNILTSISVLIVIFLFGCKTNPQQRISAAYSYKTECLGVELDGSQTLKAWGNGRNRADAIAQAYKTAVRDVLFKGISNGKPDCNVKPVVFEVNAQERHEAYFNAFFADGGAYKDFVSEKDGSRYHIEVIKERKQSGSQETYAVVVRVLRAELASKLRTDGIIK
jgi:hypothetical protein